ncbi:MAG: hypothetical protein IKH04_09155 [Kiritimatiellae bacterium]|nr:hypothetical protein [Kiritimatiellia bacterium]
MSGLGGFAPLRNNGVNTGAVQPGNVGNVPVAPNAPGNEGAVNVAPGGDQPVEADGAMALVRELDILLARAGKLAGGTVDAEALAKTARGVKLGKETEDALRAAAKDANAAMRALDTFRGSRLL